MEEYWNYLTVLYYRIPDSIYLSGLALFVIGTVLFVYFCGFSKGIKKVTLFVLIEYIFLLLCSTVIFRENNPEAVIDMKGFIDIVRDGSYYRVPEKLMNILVFIPIGILSGYVFEKLKWWNVLIFGSGISLLIEVLQLLLKRGTTEVADVILNTTGCLIGFMIVDVIKRVWDFFSYKHLRNKAQL